MKKFVYLFLFSFMFIFCSQALTINTESSQEANSPKLVKFLMDFTDSKIKSERRAKKLLIKIVSDFYDGSLDSDEIDNKFRKLDNEKSATFILIKLIDSFIKIFKLRDVIGDIPEDILNDLYTLISFVFNKSRELELSEMKYQEYFMAQIKRSLFGDKQIEVNKGLLEALDRLFDCVKKNIKSISNDLMRNKIIIIKQEYIDSYFAIKNNLSSEDIKFLLGKAIPFLFTELSKRGIGINLPEGQVIILQ